MIARIIHGSIAHRGFVLLAALVLAVAGAWSVARTPLDALPDLSDTQVIIRTSWSGQSPRIVEDQVTYPLTTTLLSVPGVTLSARAHSHSAHSHGHSHSADDVDGPEHPGHVVERLGIGGDLLDDAVRGSVHGGLLAADGRIRTKPRSPKR